MPSGMCKAASTRCPATRTTTRSKVQCSTTPLVSLFRAPISSTPPAPEPRTQPRPAMKTTYGLLTVAIFTRMPSSPSTGCVRAVTGGTTAKTPRPDPATALSRAKTDRFSSMHQGGSSFKKKKSPLTPPWVFFLLPNNTQTRNQHSNHVHTRAGSTSGSTSSPSSARSCSAPSRLSATAGRRGRAT